MTWLVVSMALFAAALALCLMALLMLRRARRLLRLALDLHVACDLLVEEGRASEGRSADLLSRVQEFV